MRRLIWLTLAILNVGCNPQGGVPLQTGHYEGSLIRRTGDKLADIPVQADVSHPDGQTWNVAVKQTDGTAIDQETLSIQTDGRIQLSIASLGVSQASLAPEQDCFSSSSSDKQQIRACAQPDAVLIEISDANGAIFSLSLKAFDPAHPNPAETPTDYSLSSAMKRTFSSNFETRAEFQRTMEASHVASNAYGNLLPHLNINTGIAIQKSLTSLTELLSAVGDLAPFLLPTRWIQAKNDSILSDVENLSLLIMRGDAGVEVESLAYNWKKDEDTLSDYATIIQDSQKLADHIHAFEPLGEYPSGTGDAVQTTVNAMKMDQSNLESTAGGEKSALAQAMGFFDEGSLATLQIDDSPAEPDLETLNEKSIQDLAAGRSLELQQMSKTLEVARNSKTGSYFQWLDPSGDPNASLGAGFPSAIQIAQDKINELENQQFELESAVRTKARDSLGEYQDAQNRVVLANQDLTLQQTRVTRDLELVNLGKETNSQELVTVYQDLLRSIMNSRNAQAEVQVARAKLNRILLEGYYSQLSFVSSTDVTQAGAMASTNN
jgi:hypothetical protein